MNGHITEVYRSDSSIIGCCNSVLILFASSAPSDADIAAMLAEMATLKLRWKSGFGFLLCLRPETRPPDQAMRDMIITRMKKMGPSIKGMACVVLGEGFGASAKRSVVAALLLGMRLDHPTKVFSEISSGVRWLTAQLGTLDGANFDDAALVRNAEKIASASVPPPSRVTPG